ncbi:MAG: GHKL domain-containing protein [Aromatoleum sp.]|nr:GHKL domain-containing protein [Aromatoleum sp.]
MKLGLLAHFFSDPVAGAEGVPAAGAAPALPQRTLRAKGILALLAMVIYVAVFALYVAHGRQVLDHIVTQQEQILDRQRALIKVNAAVAHSVVELQFQLNRRPGVPAYGDIGLDFAAIEEGLPDLRQRFPEIVPNVARFVGDVSALNAAWSAGTLTALRNSAQELGSQLEQLEDGLGDRYHLLARQYHDAIQHTFIVWVVSSLVGILLFGTLVSMFFTRLSTDIKLLESRAVAIVGGYRGPPLEIARRDEVGGLMQAVNGMQAELRRWERQQEVSRQQRFHQEKMAAVGSLAAAVAHEVNNPIAAIVGIAQHLILTAGTSPWAGSAASRDEAELILTHAERIASIMRQVASLTARHSPQPELLDLNSLVEATCNFISYDKRFDGIELATELATDLPAVNAVADHLTQVLMNLLINAADSMEGVKGRTRRIDVSTAAAEGGMLLSVTDNGCGIGPAVLARVFDEFFTTKPVERGGGIGLYLCKSLIEQNDGRIALESTPDIGTTARCFVPSSYRHRAAA